MITWMRGLTPGMEGGRISPQDQRRKTQVVAEAARAAWGG